MNLKIGKNIICVDEIELFLGYEINNWMAFIWYLTECCKVLEFSDKRVEVYIKSQKQIIIMLQKLKDYFSDLHEHNYKINKTNTLWETHHNNYWNTDNTILKRIIEA